MQNLKKIYLTFDDGIQPGTAEVLGVLQKTNVKATFFLTGINTFYSCRRNEKDTIGILQHIREKHIVGNHSFSHCHNFYSSYYAGGLLVGNDGQRMSVLEDFMKNERYLQSLLGKDDAAHLLFAKLVRLPGRNSWYFVDYDPQNVESAIFSKGEADSLNTSKNLFDNKYPVFGWHEEWRMNFDFTKDANAIKENLIRTGEIDYANYNHVYADFDMCAPQHLAKDRLTESWQDVLGRLMNSQRERIVLLLHDRSFRNTNSATKELESLIEQLQQRNILFDTLENY